MTVSALVPVAQAFPLADSSAATTGRGADVLFWILTGVSALILLLLAALVVGFVWRYHHRRDADRSRPVSNHPKLEWGVLAVITVAFLALYIGGLAAFTDNLEGPHDDDPLHIAVVGQQWMWKIQHPGGQREINALHVPVGRDVLLTLASQDVIHSFFVPAFRLKQDAVPGHFNSTWFRVDEPGTYRLLCAEYCGRDHAEMNGVVVAMPPEDYARWLAAQPVPAELPEVRGERLYEEHACGSCHDAEYADGPPLAGVYRRRVTLADGSEVVATESYLRDALLRPSSQLVAGYDDSMPTYAGALDDADILALIAYLRDLGSPAQEDANE